MVGYLSHLRLKMEHQLCLEIPRLGEMIAFRKVFEAIPPDVAMDEAFVEALVVRRGCRSATRPTPWSTTWARKRWATSSASGGATTPAIST